MQVEVTQFLRSRGRQRLQYTEVADDCEGQYHLMKQRGWRLTAEELRTGEISLAVEDPVEGDKDTEIVKNGPEVQQAIEKMLRKLD